MNCTRHDESLALYVAGDLASTESAALERHIGACLRCQGFVRELQASQGLLKAVTTDTIDERALASVRARVRSALDNRRRPSAAWASHMWRWGLAASLMLVVWALWNGRTVAPRSEPRTTAAIPSPAPIPSPLASPRATAMTANPPADSTSRRAPRVSSHREPQRAPAYGLSDEDADQLARAVVAIARVERVPEEREPTPEPVFGESPALIRLATADPDVVIYWQLDANGG